MYRDYLGCIRRLLPRDCSTLARYVGSHGCASLSDREAATARVPPLRPDVLVGVEPAETPEDGLRHGHLRDALLLPVLPLQIENRGELPQASALGAQHQVDVASRRYPSISPTDVFNSSVITTSLRGIRPRFFPRSESMRDPPSLDSSFAGERVSPRSDNLCQIIW